MRLVDMKHIEIINHYLKSAYEAVSCDTYLISKCHSHLVSFFCKNRDSGHKTVPPLLHYYVILYVLKPKSRHWTRFQLTEIPQIGKQKNRHSNNILIGSLSRDKNNKHGRTSDMAIRKSRACL